ncbi:posphoenolpyruvate synthetase regulatory kinase/phosphorylase PpsR [Pseudazoarcus pumilus]|uniref:Putative phosphoenolpyruvate synthase regulatory protein n=1 Tax=Pseudazoarcus pumilus TaxID=2067960 RepID=A0A2I6S768_9RHOO|nr:pyruvate, water dikinase regulatory protein [Pseudazoarcus pumilus]AUN95104.1 phosphoenolpyruvate synthase regulatory protein [Pseudazoarcus pumilus]
MSNPARRTAFFISGSTGITAETLGHSLLTQFPDAKVHGVRLPFVTDRERAQDCARQIRAAAERDRVRPIVFSTLVDPQIIDALRVADALYIDLFDQFIGPLESELQMQASHIAGLSHGMASSGNYQARIEAINYAMAHDDGVSSDNGLDAADVILVGVSRSGKTPTSLYLAMQFGIKAANYPLIPEDFERNRLPGAIAPHRGKLFGLTIAPERLALIREERRPGSQYASLPNCRHETTAAQKMMRREGIPWIDSTTKSIEEISATIMQAIDLEGHAW